MTQETLPEDLARQLARLEDLDKTFTKGRVTKAQELIWGFMAQVKRGRGLSKKQISILGDFEYRADTDGKGWELKK